MPDFETTNFASNKVVTDEGMPVVGAAAKVTVEIYGYSDATWGTPGLRLAALKLLHAEIEKELKQQNILTVHAWLPPQVAKAFGRRLVKIFGWRTNVVPWPCFAKEL